MKLLCALVGAEASAFSLKIDAKVMVDALKKAIKKEKPNDLKDVDADRLQLYLAKKHNGDGAWLTENDVKKDWVLGWTKLVKKMLLQETALCTCLWSFRRALEGSGDHFDQEEELAEIGDLTTPSLFATCKGGASWVRWLTKLDGQVECHRVDRSDDKSPIPIVLLNETFARFQNDCQHIEFGQKDCDFVTELCGGLSTPYDSKADFAEKARELLTDYLLVDYPSAITSTAERNVIIKFSKRYGKEVHEYCSKAGFAPELLFYEPLPNGWVFVVMEELQLVPLRQANAGGTVRDQLLKIQNALKDASFVHGDLRENNVMWDSVKNRVVLIDFDWSGKDGVATYPSFMNSEIPWPSGAECGKPLRVAHDAYWLESIVARLV